MDPSEQPLSAAQRRRRLHHSALRGQKKARAGEEESELHYTAKVRKTPLPVLFSLYGEEPGGGRPASLAEAPGPQERVPRRTVEQIGDSVLVIPLLHTFVPQMAEQLVNEPTPSFDDFELVEEEEEEEDEQRVVLESYFRDAAGREWCPILAGVYWWIIGTSSVQRTPPEVFTARPGRYRNAPVFRALDDSSSSRAPRGGGGRQES